MISNVFATCMLLVGCFFVQLGLSPAQTAPPTNTNTFQIGVGLRRQVVAPGDTIVFIADHDYQKLTPVSVIFRGTANPCGVGSQSVPSGVCVVPGNATTSAPPYSFCLSSDSTCLNSQTATKGDVSVQPASNANAPSSKVYIALTSDGQVNNLLNENDTIIWLDKDGNAQDTKLTGISLLGPATPCFGQSGAHQHGPCQAHVPWLMKKISFTYDCEPVSCSDPVVHLIKPSGGAGMEWIVESVFHLGLTFLVILAVAFVVRFSVRKR